MASLQSCVTCQDLLNSIKSEIVVLDQDGTIQMVNEHWIRFARDNGTTNVSSEPYTGTNYLTASKVDCDDPWSSASKARDGIRGVLTGALPSFSFEYPCHSPERLRWFSMQALPLGLERQLGCTITHTDITAYKLAEENIHIAAVAFETQEAIVVMDSQRRILRTNQAFTRITGYSEQESIGKTTAFLRSMRHSDSIFEDIWRRVLKEGRVQSDLWLRHKSGDDFFAMGTATSVKGQQGELTHYVIMFSDQTLKQQQSELREQQETAHRDALVREVHHRIKNNLQGIGGLLEQFARQKPEIAEQMQLVAGHLSGIGIIHGLQGRHDKSMVRLCELTREIAQSTSLIWQTEINVDIPANWVFRVVAEREAVSLALILNELLVNAVKHGGKAHGRVNIAFEQGGSIEGVELSILNVGSLRDKEDAPTSHHHGLRLIESLRPREGLILTLAQCGDSVRALLEITSPLLSLETEN